MFHINLSRISRLLAVSAVAWLSACGSPTGSDGYGGGYGGSNAVTGTARFTAAGGPVAHNVYMAAFFVHDQVVVGPVSNFTNLGQVANQPVAFSLTPVFPQNADADDFITFDVWVDDDDNGTYDGETIFPLPTAPNDPVFLVDDTLLMWKPDGWHFENDQGGVGDLYYAHMKDGAVLVSVSVN